MPIRSRGSGENQRRSADAARTHAPVPARALLLSGSALAIPLVSEWYQPGLATEQFGLLLWLPSLVPAFLLTYSHGDGGAPRCRWLRAWPCSRSARRPW